MQEAKIPRCVWLPRKYSKLPLTNLESPPLLYKSRQASTQYFLTISVQLFNFPPKKITFLLPLLSRSFEPDCLFPTMKKSALFSVSLAATISAFTPNFQFTSEVHGDVEVQACRHGSASGDVRCGTEGCGKGSFPSFFC
ncbi:uncharacterized protein [Gossypium hirsutum]|uniref:Uncharacterized protein isoform X2 n=1 Tax=Gossypium hirsutum TaxID=3635 RepID=A0A1U8HJT8_GOSHI|nr:uncharacterized protein LOC107886772 isoform X2 [Gossypium hirsutum]